MAKIFIGIFLFLCTISIMSQSQTNWNIEPSFKYDALCFLNILTADTFYLTYYKDEYNKFKDKITETVKLSLISLKKNLKENNGRIISAYLCLYFSAVEDSTLEQMTTRLDNLDELKKNFEKTPYHDEESWNLFVSAVPDLKVIFAYLKEIDFEGYWNQNILPLVQKKINETQPGLKDYDVIKENEYLLGYKLPSNEIVVYMLYYVRPHGIKITGTRFLTDVAWPFNIVIRTAAHEMMHPPYDPANDTELKEVIESLRKDDFLMDKVNNHNPSFGYNTLEGLFEEDCVQAMDQLINEKFGIAKDAKQRWKESDDGIHVFAIALYQVMKEENYNSKNEVFRDFLVRMIKSGRLSAGKIKAFYDKFYN
ncbi:MAG: hypothetical protein EHM58_09320 [Ignavibacteriae bacterium]|nr:MAG: hypothetical protein EHM58_09320 [Ignavibacteriota bacterium]